MGLPTSCILDRKYHRQIRALCFLKRGWSTEICGARRRKLCGLITTYWSLRSPSHSQKAKEFGRVLMISSTRKISTFIIDKSRGVVYWGLNSDRKPEAGTCPVQRARDGMFPSNHGTGVN